MDVPEKRPTMQELAAGARQGGLVCPECGCRHFRVCKTKPGDGIILRRRECRHCGRRITTFEQ